MLLVFASSLAQEIEKGLNFSSDYSLSLEGCVLELNYQVHQAIVTL